MNVTSQIARRFVRFGLLGCIIPLLIACGSASTTTPPTTSNTTPATGTSTTTPVITGTITEFPTVISSPSAVRPVVQIGRMTPTGSVTGFPVTPDTEPVAITVGSDGNLWYTKTIKESNASQIGRFTVEKL